MHKTCLKWSQPHLFLSSSHSPPSPSQLKHSFHCLLSTFLCLIPFFCQLSYFFFLGGKTRSRRKENAASQVNNTLPKRLPSSICLFSEKHTHKICSSEGLCAIRGCWGPLWAGRHGGSSRTGLSPTIPARSGAAGGTRAAPALDTGLAPPRDGMLPATREVCPVDQRATDSQGLQQKQLPGARVRAGCSLPQPCWEPLLTLQWDRGSSWLHSVPHSHSQSPRSGMLPGSLHRAADKPGSFAQAWQVILFCMFSTYKETTRWASELKKPWKQNSIFCPKTRCFHQTTQASQQLSWFSCYSFLVVCFSSKASPPYWGKHTTIVS